jgi:hypothetical protein
MADVQEFTRGMIEKYLKGRSLKYLVDDEGDFRVGFAYDEETGCSMVFWLIAGGSKDQIYLVRCMTDKKIPRSDWQSAIMLCNSWNKETRWPKAYLYVKDQATDTVGEIYLEEQIDVGVGIHQELLEDFTDTVIGTANEFWKWAHKEKGM